MISEIKCLNWNVLVNVMHDRIILYLAIEKKFKKSRKKSVPTDADFLEETSLLKFETLFDY